MKVCPQCHDEYRDEIVTCLECGIPLESGAIDLKKSVNVAQTVDLTTAVKVFEGQLDACREIETLLKREKIASVLVPIGKEDLVIQGRMGVGDKAITYALCVNSDSVENFVAIMKARFDEMVEREHSKEWTLNEVHLDGSDVTCPACGHTGPLVNGHCTDCDLFLGVNEA